MQNVVWLYECIFRRNGSHSFLQILVDIGQSLSKAWPPICLLHIPLENCLYLLCLLQISEHFNLWKSRGRGGLENSLLSKYKIWGLVQLPLPRYWFPEQV